MPRYTKQLRQQILDEFTQRHNGHWNPRLFLDEVEAVGPEHPAHEWFEWSDEAAAAKYRIEQARDFSRGLRVRFTVEDVFHGRSVRVVATAPAFISPEQTRPLGGGYLPFDPDSAEHEAELSRQAASALQQWLRRYQSTLARRGIDDLPLRVIVAALMEQVTAAAAE